MHGPRADPQNPSGPWDCSFEPIGAHDGGCALLDLTHNSQTCAVFPRVPSRSHRSLRSLPLLFAACLSAYAESQLALCGDQIVEHHSSAAPSPPDTAVAATKREPPTMDASTISPSLSQGDSNQERNRLRPTLSRMRRSCSECGRKKRSCDGQRPCG